MAIARDLIIEDIVSSLEGIDGTGDYVNTVDTVARYARTWNEVNNRRATGTGSDQRPWIGVVPGVETYEYQPGDCIRVSLTVNLFCHLDGATLAARQQGLNDLLDDIFIAIMADQTLGGNAVSVYINSSQTDEVDEYGTASMLVTMTVIYFRDTGVS